MGDDFENLVNKIYEYLLGPQIRQSNVNIIRKHTKKLNELGDLSFPLNIKNWLSIINRNNKNLERFSTIFDLLLIGANLQQQIDSFIEANQQWTSLQINNYKIIDNNDLHLYLNKEIAFKTGITKVFELKENFGSNLNCLKNNYCIQVNNSLDLTSDISLSELRLVLLKKITTNLINFVNKSDLGKKDKCNVKLTLKSSEIGQNTIKCGLILNENGTKDCETTAQQLYNKRIIDMQLMAQHKYGVQVKNSLNWKSYFEKLGTDSVTIEMLQNKTHKNIKISLNNLQTANKGAAFIFYNCARLAALFRKFQGNVDENIYPSLPPLTDIDFSLLNQPEEWELLYVYILQFPMLISDCIRDIDKKTINPHYLVIFLSNLSSVFSVYYRRVKILTNPKEHLYPILYARIYLLKALQQVFHNVLFLLNIEPVKEM